MFAFAGGFDRMTLQTNLYVFQYQSFGSRWIIIVGIWVACFTSGLGGLMGGSRILQAIARDNVYPFIGWAGRGFGSGDEPRFAILVTGAIAQRILFWLLVFSCVHVLLLCSCVVGRGSEYNCSNHYDLFLHVLCVGKFEFASRCNRRNSEFPAKIQSMTEKKKKKNG